MTKQQVTEMRALIDNIETRLEDVITDLNSSEYSEGEINDMITSMKFVEKYVNENFP